MALDCTERITTSKRGLVISRQFEKNILSVEIMSFQVEQHSEEMQTD